MEAISFQTLFQLPSPLRKPSYVEREKIKKILGKKLHERIDSPAAKRLSISLASRTVKLPSCVRIQEIVEGQGPAAHEEDLVEINYVCRCTNGYFVHSTVDQFSGESAPVILPLDEKQIIEGLKEVLVGMIIGKRRAMIPPCVGYVNENLKPIPEEFGPRRSLLSHVSEPLIFEVRLLKVL